MSCKWVPGRDRNSFSYGALKMPFLQRPKKSQEAIFPLEICHFGKGGGRREPKSYILFSPQQRAAKLTRLRRQKKWRLSLEAFALIPSMPNPSLRINHIWSNSFIERHLERPRKKIRKRDNLKTCNLPLFTGTQKKHFRY